VLGLIATNLFRRRARTLATALGIALGIATIVALLSVGGGLKRTASGLVHLGQADLGLFQSGVSDPTASLVPVALARRLEARPDVASATPLLLIVEGVKRYPPAITFGADPNGFFARRLVMLRGRPAAGTTQVAVGYRLAKVLHLRVGSPLTVARKPFTVSGVYHTGVFFEDAGAVLPLARAQRLAHRPGEATTIAVQLAADAHHDQAKTAIRRAFPGTTVLGTGDDASRAGANGRIVSTTETIMAALALIVGGLGVANTMAMAVMERRRELALLSAVGWRRLRIALLVLGEGIAVSILGAALGLVLGTLGARWLSHQLGVSDVVTLDVTPWTIGQALLIGCLVGTLGSLYPAWRGTAVSGAELLAGA
jgi:putative ABC transport system permease protein